MKKMMIAMLVILLIVSLTSCALIGRGKDFRPMDEQTLVKVKPGVTTATEVTTLFGPPNQIVKLSNGNAYLYHRSVNKALGIWLVLVTMVDYDIQHDRMVFFFNKEDVLTHYGSSFKSETAAYGTPF